MGRTLVVPPRRRSRKMAMRHRVLELSEREGWTDTELARRLGVSGSYISRLRHGSRDVSIPLIVGARRVWPDFPLDYLFPRDPEGAKTA